MSDKQKKAVKKKAVEGREAETKAAGKEPAKRKPVKKKKGKKSGKGFVVLFIVIVVLLIGAGSAFVLLNQNKEIPILDTVETMVQPSAARHLRQRSLVTAYWQVWYRVECPWKRLIVSGRRKRY